MIREEGRKVYTVSELNREIKTVLEDTYPDIWVEGEVSGLKTYGSGHTYFYLKDGESQLPAVIFQGMGRSIKFELEDGLKVIVRGRVTAYPKRGDYQIIVNYAEPAGVGALQLAFEQLKAKLQSEGLFDASRKRSIPLLVQKIGIVTSPDGAALRDILSVIERRYANVSILIYPARVQGDEAKYEITEAIEYLNNNHPDLDVLLVGRGGGSYQDLWAFNEEIVARAIYNSKIPVISCVGHEVGVTIADFVADLRAPTPSVAAELVVKNKQEMKDGIDNFLRRLMTSVRTVVEADAEKLENLAGSKVLEKPEGMIEMNIQRVDELSSALRNGMVGLFEGKTSLYAHAAEKLGLVSPLNVLSRGYSICSGAGTGKILKDASALEPGDRVKVTLHSGGFSGVVEEVVRAEREK